MPEGDFEFSCESCGGRLLVSPGDVGQTVQCSYCSATVVVPAPEAAGNPASPEAPPAPPPPAGPYPTAPPPPPAWAGAPPPAYPPAYGAPTYGAAPYGVYAAPFYTPLPPAKRSFAPLLITLAVVGVFVGLGAFAAIHNRVSQSRLTAHWSLAKSASGRLVTGRMDLNSDGTFVYTCTNVAGRSFSSSGTWQLLNRRLILHVQSGARNSAFGNKTTISYDVKDVSGATLHLLVKEGVQTWTRL